MSEARPVAPEEACIGCGHPHPLKLNLGAERTARLCPRCSLFIAHGAVASTLGHALAEQPAAPLTPDDSGGAPLFPWL